MMKTSPALPQVIRLRSPWRVTRVLLGAMLLLGALIGSAHAADDKRAEREAHRAEQLQQRLEQQQATFDTQRADLQKQISDAKLASDGLEATNQKTSAALQQVGLERGKLQKTVADLTRQLADAKRNSEKNAADAQAQLAAFAQAREQERVAQNSRFDVKERALAVCTDKNQRLLSIGHELLTRYQNKNVIDAMRQQEPVLGFTDVEVFNEVQDYRDKVDALQVEAPVPNQTKSAQ